MVVIPTIENEENARHPAVNAKPWSANAPRYQSHEVAAGRSAIRSERQLRRAAPRLMASRTPDGSVIPLSTLEEIRRATAWHGSEEIGKIAQARLEHPEEPAAKGSNAMMMAGVSAGIIGVDVRR
jgi:hypothetical protein